MSGCPYVNARQKPKPHKITELSISAMGGFFAEFMLNEVKCSE